MHTQKPTLESNQYRVLSVSSPIATCDRATPVLVQGPPSKRLWRGCVPLEFAKIGLECAALQHFSQRRGKFLQHHGHHRPQLLPPPMTHWRLFQCNTLPLNVLGEVGCAWMQAQKKDTLEWDHEFRKGTHTHPASVQVFIRFVDTNLFV
jgi:hypothetical protein